MVHDKSKFMEIYNTEDRLLTLRHRGASNESASSTMYTTFCGIIGAGFLYGLLSSLDDFDRKIERVFPAYTLYLSLQSRLEVN